MDKKAFGKLAISACAVAAGTLYLSGALTGEPVMKEDKTDKGGSDDGADGTGETGEQGEGDGTQSGTGENGNTGNAGEGGTGENNSGVSNNGSKTPAAKLDMTATAAQREALEKEIAALEEKSNTVIADFSEMLKAWNSQKASREPAQYIVANRTKIMAWMTETKTPSIRTGKGARTAPASHFP